VLAADLLRTALAVRPDLPDVLPAQTAAMAGRLVPALAAAHPDSVAPALDSPVAVTRLYAAIADTLRAATQGADADTKGAAGVVVVEDVQWADSSSLGLLAYLVRRLAAKADALIENNRPGVADRLGVGYADIRRINHKIVYCSISGFGPDGPNANAPAYDPLIQGYSGLTNLQGARIGRPMGVQMAMADKVTGMTAALCLVSALHAARNRGVIVDKNVRAVIHRRAIEHRFNQDESFAILIAGRVGQLVIGTGELPVEKPEERVSCGFWVRRETGW